MNNNYLLATILLAFGVALAAATVVEERFADNSWCGTTCYVPSEVASLKTEFVAKFPITSASKCGDGKCNINLLESCHSCPQDCGTCRFSTAIQSCKTPGHVALTFDDGPSNFTPGLLDTLKKYNAKATFFVLGQVAAAGVQSVAQRDPIVAAAMAAVIKRASDEGHIIGVHTYTHASIVTGQVKALSSITADDSTTVMQLLATDQIVNGIIGKRPRLFRAPYLEENAKSLGMVQTLGYIPVSINVDSNDWTYAQYDVTAAKASVLRDIEFGLNTQKTAVPPVGSIVLQHDTNDYSVASVEKIIQLIQQDASLKIVPMDTCLGMDAASFYLDSASPQKFGPSVSNTVTSSVVTTATTTAATTTTSVKTTTATTTTSSIATTTATTTTGSVATTTATTSKSVTTTSSSVKPTSTQATMTKTATATIAVGSSSRSVASAFGIAVIALFALLLAA